MSLLHSILLGLVQGVAEFLPISSSGHLAIVEQILGVKGAVEVPGFFDVLLHLGTLAAVFVAYWPEIWEMIQEFFRGISDLIPRHNAYSGASGAADDPVGDRGYTALVRNFGNQGLDRESEQ